MSITKRNKGSRFTFNTQGLEFRTLAELYAENGENEIYTLRGVYINEGSIYGASPFAAIDGCLVNLPSHMVNTIREIISDDEDVAQINAGLAGFTIKPYHSEKYGKDTFVIDFVDVVEVKDTAGKKKSAK